MSRNRTRVQTQRRIAESAVAGVHIAPAEPLSPQPPALGNMSEADLAAIRGAAPMTASELLASGGVPVTDGEPFEIDAPAHREATPEEIHNGARLATLEARVAELQRAVQALAENRTVQPMAQAQTPVSVRPPTPEEEAAYCETNFARSQQGGQQFDGVQAWRDAGSPAEKAAPVVSILQRGRAA